MTKTDQDLTAIQKKAQTTEKSLKKKKRKRKIEKKDNTLTLNERLIAPLLLIITMLISYLIFLFS